MGQRSGWGQVRYAPQHRAGMAELWLPAGAPTAAALPVVVLLHGGYWRAMYTKRLMHPLARAVVEQGWAAYNVEYRRTGLLGGGGGWPATFIDVAAAVDHIAELPELDATRVVTCGHSAGGHLALWAAARGRLPADAPGARPRVAVRGAISLAGVVDLERAADTGLGAGAVATLLGGSPRRRPDRYAAASPARLLPLGVPQVLLHGDTDGVVPLSLSADYTDRAVAAGDDARLVTLAGVDHMAVIQPSSPAWPAIVEATTAFVA